MVALPTKLIAEATVEQSSARSTDPEVGLRQLHPTYSR